jgi:hypothetical protein
MAKTINSSRKPKAERLTIDGMATKLWIRRQNDRGGVGLWIFIIVLLVGGWAGFRIGKLYFDHSTIENEVVFIGEHSLTSERVDPKARVIQLMQAYDVTLKPDDITVELSESADRMTISFPYLRRADLVAIKPLFGFEIEVESQAKESMGIVQQVQDNIQDSHNNSAQKYKRAIENATGR